MRSAVGTTGTRSRARDSSLRACSPSRRAARRDRRHAHLGAAGPADSAPAARQARPRAREGDLSWHAAGRNAVCARRAASGTPVPLLVLLHGGGGQARDFHYMFPLAEEFGVALLPLDARHNTWDGVDSPFGPDVLFIDTALRYTSSASPSIRHASRWAACRTAACTRCQSARSTAICSRT